MGKVLKLGFAMGGGVSLGSFSGGALTEAIKMLILYGKDKEGVPYDDIEIDVFSGASAGSMSLCIMLRALVDQTDEQRATATASLRKEFGSEFDELSDTVKAKLVAAQVAQDVQKSIWVDEINLDKLLGKLEGQKDRDLNYLPSILDRGALEDIARKYFDMRPLFSDPNFKFGNKQLLTERVLFASTLTNLTKIQYDARPEYSKENKMNYLGLEDGLTSNGHRDMRIFDFNFEKITDMDKLQNKKSYPPRWCRYHLGGESHGNIGDLKKQDTWSKVIATSIACGAFPFAFEPVVLNRRKYEFGENIWPKMLADKGIDRYPFTYVDGGTLNNEPIREAFRLASFMDAADTRDNTERLIVFVDPYVNEPQPYFGVPIHKEYKIEEATFLEIGSDQIRLNSLDRMIPHIGSMLSVLTDQAKVVERDKIYQVRHKIDERNKFRDYLKKGCAGSSPDNALFEEVGKTIQDKLKSNRENMAIPPGSLSLNGELLRVILESDDLARLSSGVDGFVSNENKEADPDAGIWLYLYYCVLLDLTMDMTGKSKETKIVAIAPVVLDENGNSEIVPLPGKPLSAFGGFTSSLPSAYEVRLAKHCARLFLEVGGFIQKKPGGLPPHPVFEDDIQYKKDLKAGLVDLSERVREMVKKSHLLNISAGVDQVILFFVNNKIKSVLKELNFEEDPIATFTFKVEVPSKKFELDGNKANSDFKPVIIDGKYYLITEIDYHLHPEWQDGKRWEGLHIISDKQLLDIDLNGIIDRNFCTIELPDAEMVEEARLMPNPTFETRIAMGDKGKPLGKEKWKVGFGVTSLEDTIVGD